MSHHMQDDAHALTPHAGPAPEPAGAARTRKPGGPLWIAVAAIGGGLLVGGGAIVGVLAQSQDRIAFSQVPSSTVQDPAPAVGQEPAAGAGSTPSSTTTGDGTSATGDAGSGSAPGGTAATDATTTLPAGAVYGDRDDIELHGDELSSAVAAALAASGGEGVVTGVDRSDDPTHAYEVELTRSNGTEMDVYLDRSFGVVAVQGWHLD